jgi:hypothetical protein
MLKLTSDLLSRAGFGGTLVERACSLARALGRTDTRRLANRLPEYVLAYCYNGGD